LIYVLVLFPTSTLVLLTNAVEPVKANPPPQSILSVVVKVPLIFVLPFKNDVPLTYNFWDCPAIPIPTLPIKTLGVDALDWKIEFEKDAILLNNVLPWTVKLEFKLVEVPIPILPLLLINNAENCVFVNAPGVFNLISNEELHNPSSVVIILQGAWLVVLS